MLVTILPFQQFLTVFFLGGEPIPLGQWKHLGMLKAEAAHQNQRSENLLKRTEPDNAHQPPTLATQAGILEPSSHVLMRIHNKRSDHQYPLPVFHNSLTALRGKRRKNLLVFGVLCTGQSLDSDFHQDRDFCAHNSRQTDIRNYFFNAAAHEEGSAPDSHNLQAAECLQSNDIL